MFTQAVVFVKQPDVIMSTVAEKRPYGLGVAGAVTLQTNYKFFGAERTSSQCDHKYRQISY